MRIELDLGKEGKITVCKHPQSDLPKDKLKTLKDITNLALRAAVGRNLRVEEVE
ncbi:MAG: hypothetical protein NC548_27140 [Lachnospiraceae bacterium]|nr:hypothetical protein [Lachnospiraceae bacterium]